MRFLFLSLPLALMACTDKEDVEDSDITDTDGDDTGTTDTDTDTDTDTNTDTGSDDIDADGDGVFAEDDCDDTNPDLGAIADDADCDGVQTVLDCDDANPDASYLYSTAEMDYETDGNIDFMMASYELYDENDRQIFLFNDVDTDGDGQADSTVSIEQIYDSDGNLTEQLAFSDFLDGANYIDTHTVYSYSPEGLILNENRAINAQYDTGAYAELQTMTYTYNPENQLDSQTMTVDVDIDGAVNQATTIHYLYDGDGLLIEVMQEGDHNGDGMVDSLSITQNIYANQLLLQTDTGYDTDADGTMNTTETTMYLYDNAANPIHRETLTYNDAVLSTIDISLSTYTPENWVETTERLWDGEGDGVPNYRDFSHWTYDGAGNILTFLTARDDGFDNTDDSIVLSSFVYDSENRVLENIIDSDSDADGNTDNLQTTVYSYDGCESF